MEANRQWRLARPPLGLLKHSDVTLSSSHAPSPNKGEVLVRNVYLSLDPSIRGRLDGSMSYSAPIKIGDVLPARSIGCVAQSNHPALQNGDWVVGILGWEDYSLAQADTLTRLDREDTLPLTAHFGVLGHIGLTAYVGVLDYAKPQPGETMLVSAAAGAVGSIAAQIGKIAGCRVIGIAGGPEKCRWLVEDIGLDGAIDYKAGNLTSDMERLCPSGVDIFFDNVGGATLDAALARINIRARIVICGLISQYIATGEVRGPANLANLLYKRARMEGFINFDHLDRAPACNSDLRRWLAEGRLVYRTHIVQGLENAPAAFNSLFDGTNIGKLIVQLDTSISA